MVMTFVSETAWAIQYYAGSRYGKKRERTCIDERRKEVARARKGKNGD